MTSEEKKIELYGLMKDQRIHEAQNYLLNFTTYTKPDYYVNWHHERLCGVLDRFISGEIKRLMIFEPPRTGKSELVSRRLPAYIFGKDPDANIIACSYGADLASQMNRDVQRIIDSPAYVELFPDTRLSGKNIKTLAYGNYLRNSEIFEIVDHSGVYKCAGVGGAITGLGANFALIDDPVKNQEEANSKVFRDRAWDWYRYTVYTRLEKDASILLTMTRWHEDDLAGRLIEKMNKNKEADQWFIVVFPAIKETEPTLDDPREIGEALWPEKYSANYYKKFKATAGSKVWGSLFQQTPTPDKGEIVQAGWFKFYREPPADMEYITTSWDFTFKKGHNTNFVVGQAWGKQGANRYLLDQVRARMSFTETIQAMRTFAAKWHNAREIIVEEKANGSAVIDTLKNEIPGIIAYNPKESKESRLNAVAPQIEAGNVYVPDPSIAPWVHDYMQEIVAFPGGKYDDQTDCTSQILLRMRESDWITMLADQGKTESVSEELQEMFGWHK